MRGVPPPAAGSPEPPRPSAVAPEDPVVESPTVEGLLLSLSGGLVPAPSESPSLAEAQQPLRAAGNPVASSSAFSSAFFSMPDNDSGSDTDGAGSGAGARLALGRDAEAGGQGSNSSSDSDDLMRDMAGDPELNSPHVNESF